MSMCTSSCMCMSQGFEHMSARPTHTPSNQESLMVAVLLPTSAQLYDCLCRWLLSRDNAQLLSVQYIGEGFKSPC